MNPEFNSFSSQQWNTAALNWLQATKSDIRILFCGPCPIRANSAVGSEIGAAFRLR